MRTRSLAAAATFALAADLVGCVPLKRSPEARFFVLRSLVEPESSRPAGRSADLVGVLPVVLPGHLERPQIVTWRAPGELRIDEFLRWAEPLDAGITRVLVENLDALLPSSPVVRAPWPSSAKPRFRLRVELRLFGLQESGEARLEGRWAVLPGDGERPHAFKWTSLRRGPLAPGSSGLDPGAGVDAMSALLADLAREIADAIRNLPPPAEP